MDAKNGACPHCGAPTDLTTSPWSEIAPEDVEPICMSCGHPVNNMVESDSVQSNRPILKFGVILLTLLGAVWFLNHIFLTWSLKENFLEIMYEVLFIGLISYLLAFGNIWRNIKQLSVWALIFLVLLGAYSYRHELEGIKNRMIATLIPAHGLQQSSDSMQFQMAADGHFHVRAHVNGIAVPFLVDTGASHIVLSLRAAQRIGFDLSKQKFDRIYETANGRVRGSSVRLDSLRIGDLSLTNIKASINEAQMSESLMGMTFFKYLKRYEFNGDTLTLYWNAEAK